MKRTLLILLLTALLLAGLTPGPAAAAAGSGPDFAAIDAYVEAQRQAAGVPGLAIGVVRDGQVVHLAGFGQADGDGLAVSDRTPFVIGSLSKGFTALAILQLEESGRLDLDDPVQAWLPWFSLPDTQAAASLTLRMLLNQTSGLGYNDGTRPLWDRPGEYTLESRLHQLADVGRVMRQPGSAFEYSNYNYMLLGAVVEAASGLTYAEYLQQAIFDPLAMGDSAAGPRAGLAGAHRWWFGLPAEVDAVYPQDAVPAGFIVSSVHDMAAYLAFQQAGQPGILSAQGLTAMHAACVPSGRQAEYCYGWVRGAFAGVEQAIFHEGAAEGYYAIIASDPDSLWGVVVLSNANHMLNAPARDIAAAVLGFLANGSPLQVRQTFLRTYILIDSLVLLVTGVLIWHTTRLPGWARRLVTRRPRGPLGWGGRLVLPVLGEFVVPFVIWIFLPQGAGFPIWKLMGIFQPDLTAWVMLLAGLFVLRGLLRGVLAWAALRKGS